MKKFMKAFTSVFKQGKRPITEKIRAFGKKAKHFFQQKKAKVIAAVGAVVFFIPGNPALAADTQGINWETGFENLKTFFYAVLIFMGAIFIGLGIYNFAMSFQSHDESQKGKAIGFLVGGIALCAAPSIINMISGM